DQIGLAGDAIDVRDLALERELDADLAASILEDRQEHLAGEAAKAVARGGDHRPAEMGLDITPVTKAAADPRHALRIFTLERAERLVRKDDAPPERVVGPIALENGDIALG